MEELIPPFFRSHFPTESSTMLAAYSMMRGTIGDSANRIWTDKFIPKLLEMLYSLCGKLCEDRKCPLTKEPHFGKFVHMEGPPTAEYMFIGEALGADEVEQSRPFIGVTGQKLRKMLSIIPIPEDNYILTNVCHCRPAANRTPTYEEAGICGKWILLNEIFLVKPKIIFAVGAVASAFLLQQKNVKITQIVGEQHETKYGTVIPIFHPSYILRKEGGPQEKEIKASCLAAVRRGVSLLSDRNDKQNPS